MEKEERINNNQFYGMITGEELGWQSMIYDLIKTEQLDPWDIDIEVLAEKYLETVRELEDANFYISSKVLLACSLLLRLKSEILANTYIQELNDSLFGKKEMQKTLDFEKLIINEHELPLLLPKSPMARSKKVTLEQLMAALNKAINTENRRIKREIKTHQAKKMMDMVLPKDHFVPLKIRIKNILGVISSHFDDSTNKHLLFHSFAQDREEKMAAFLPILHLTTDNHIFLHQPVHFDEIFITKEMHADERKLLSEQLEAYA